VDNPFTPTFGVIPPVLAGRDQELTAFRRAIKGKPGEPGRAMLLTGPRGSGKTALLNTIQAAAREAGWVVVAETAHAGLAEDLTLTELPLALLERDPHAADNALTGISVGALGFSGSISRDRTPKYTVRPNFRSQLTALAKTVQADGDGVLLCLDEVQRASAEDMERITQAVQHMFSEGRQVAFACAGLPSAIRDILNDHVTTFMRRAMRFDLGRLTPDQVSRAIADPIRQAGRRIQPDALVAAVAAAAGYPFLVQAIGYATWDAAGTATTITKRHAAAGITVAKHETARLLHEPALHDLSPRDREFLDAMAKDDGPSRIADVAARMGVTQSFASTYRQRLIAAEVIEPAGRGLVDYAIPLLREHLRGQL
jgi:type II secretory pathway predicted ATPase ExeA